MKVRKKTYLLPQKLINSVKNAYGAKTETDAIIKALEEVAFQNEILKLHRQFKGRLKIRDVYGR